MSRLQDIEFYAANRRMRAYRKRVFIQEFVIALVLAACFVALMVVLP